MNRRGFLGLLGAAVPFAAAGTTLPSRPDETFGYLTPELVMARGYDNGSVRVFFNGVDVREHPLSLKVLACDDRAGWIDVLARDARGQYVRSRHGTLARFRLYGDVRVTMQRRGASI